MSNIRIVADSTCDIDPELIRNLNLEILPLAVTIDGRSYLDGEEIGIAEVYGYMRRGVVPKTSQIPYDRAHDLFQSLLDAGSDVIYISFSSELSGCYAMGSMIAEELAKQYPDRKIAVLDSRGGSGATGLIVLQALNLADTGLPFEEVLSELRFMIEHVEHVFSVGDLEWLAKGGRIPRAVGYIGSKLGFHPLLDVEGGRMVVIRMIRGKLNALQTVADEVIRRAGKFPAQLISICHADDLPAAKKLAALVKEGLPGCSITLCHIGGVLGVHLGLKGIGAFFFNQKPEKYRLV
ncbi:MAG: DegV family protein [Clostridiaceae bacterium]|nr:DegV family protein [Clostridiaceae bacterium]